MSTHDGFVPFFKPHQRATVEAAMARIIPTDHEPGAREAGAIDFLERYLSGIDFIYARPDGSGFERLRGRRADAWRRRVDAVRDTYIAGVEDLDRRATESFGASFVDGTEQQQDQILTDLEHGTTASGERVRPNIAYGGPVELALQQTSAEIDLDFFALLVVHTRQGFYSDPVYGGNRDHVGWRVIGFPGPSHMAEVHTGRYSTLPWFAEDPEHPTQERDHDR